MGIKNYSLRVDESVYRLLRVAAGLNGMSMAGMLRKIITEYLENDDEVMEVQRHWEGKRERHGDEKTSKGKGGESNEH